eukprot:6743734-Ditylum_brightwellii.AAC.1
MQKQHQMILLLPCNRQKQNLSCILHCLLSIHPCQMIMQKQLLMMFISSKGIIWTWKLLQAIK